MKLSKKEIRKYVDDIDDLLNTNISKAKDVVDKLILSSNHIDDDDLQSQVLFKIGRFFSLQSNYTLAIKYYNSCSKLFKKLDNKAYLEKVYSNLGNVNYHIGNFNSSIEYVLKSIELDKELDDSKSLSISYNTMGAIYFSLERYDKSLDYYLKALDLFFKESREKSAKDLDTIAMLNSNIGATYIRLNNHEEALRYLKESITVRILSNNKYGKAQSFHNLASLYFKMKQYTKSLKYYNKSVKLKEELNDNRGLSASYVGIAELYEKQGNSLNTEFYLKKAIERSEGGQNFTILVDIYEKLAIFYERYGYFKESLEYYKKYTKLNSKLYNNEKDKKVEDLKMKFEIIEKEQKAEIYRLRSVELKKAYDEIDKLICNILPKKITKELNEKGKVIPKMIKGISVLMADLKGFTAKASLLTPQELISELNDLYTIFDNICEEENCERIKTIGDAYMAVSSIEEGSPEASKNLVTVAKKMIIALTKRNLINDIKDSWTLRIGIATGDVVGGIVGIKKYLYDIFGDTVNIATRLESVSKEMKVTVDRTTAKVLSQDFKFKSLGLKNLKGKGEVKVYELEG